MIFNVLSGHENHVISSDESNSSNTHKIGILQEIEAYKDACYV